MISLKEVAKICGVSITSVHNALHSPSKLSEDVRQKILDTLRDEGYFKKLKSKDSVIGIVCQNLSDHLSGEYYDWVFTGIFQELAKQEIKCRFYDGFDVKFEQLYDVKGIIFVGVTPDEYIQFVQKIHLPFVLIGHPNMTYHSQVSTVYVDVEPAFESLLNYIVSCGHQNIAYITGITNPSDILATKYQRVWRKVMLKNQLENNCDNIYQANYSEIQTIDIVWNTILSSKKGITCLVCSNDLIAYWCYRLANKYQISIPRDISITGFDGIFFPRLIDPPAPELTTVYVDRAAIGKTGVDLLLTKIKGKNVPEEKLIPGHLKIGSSVARHTA